MVQSQHVLCLGKLFFAAVGVDKFPCSLGLAFNIAFQGHTCKLIKYISVHIHEMDVLCHGC